MDVKGPLTGVLLSDISGLFRRSPRAPGVYDGAPNHSRQSVQLSYELAAASYTMDPDVWIQAGWRDFSMMVNRSLMTGEMLNSAGTPLNDLTRATLQTLAKIKMSALNPVEQYLSLRQPDDETNSLKAIVMLKPHAGLMTVGISFMGTGKQIGDWTANLRMDPQDGLHEGFLQLTQEFTERLTQIVFPYGAFRMNRSSLTLAEIIETLKRPGSLFRLWVSGHSQGAAVMQIFIDQLLRGGVLPEYLCGFGFASPSVAYPGRPLPAGGYPITHIVNQDDLVPRVGAWLHLGEYLVFTPEEADRSRMYGSLYGTPCFEEACRLLRRAATAPEALLNGIAIMRVMHQQSEQSLRRMLGETGQNPLGDWLSNKEETLLKTVDSIAARLERGYMAVSGEPFVPQMALLPLAKAWNALLRQYGMSQWIISIRDACLLPHRLYKQSGSETPAYRYIVTEGCGRLKRRSVSAAGLTAVSGGTALPRTGVRTVYPSWSSGRTFRKAAISPFAAPEIPAPAATADTAPFAAPLAPSAPRPVRAAQKAISSVSRYASAFRLLSASRARKRGK